MPAPRSRRVGHVVTLLVCVGAATAALHASAQQNGVAVGSPVQPGVAQNGHDPAGLAAFERAAKSYGALKSYRHAATAEMVIKAKDTKGEDASQSHPMQSMLVFARGEGAGGSVGPRLKAAGQHGTLASDGTNLTVYLNQLDQYTQTPATKVNKLFDDDQANQYIQTLMDPATSILLRAPASGESLVRFVTKIKGARAEELDGRPGTRVDVVFSEEVMPGSPEAPTGSVWFDQASGLIGAITTDMTPMYREMYANMPEPEEGEEDDHGGAKLTVEKAAWTWSLRDIVVDAPVSDADVAFAPPSSAKKVEEFDFVGSGREVAQLELIGKPAPDFTCDAFKEGSFSLSSQRGRVVVMDFWATWCGPCVAAIPSIQTLHEKFKDKPVTVVGINQDAGDAKKVLAFLEKKKITFTQVNDKDSSVGKLYNITGIPCAVIIDQQGVIQDIHVGGTPDLGDELAEKVEKLLKGEKIIDDKQLAERLSAAKEGSHAAAFESEDDEGSSGDANNLIPPVNPERLVAAGRVRANYIGMGMREVDVDGDGVLERAMPTSEGRLSILGADGAVARTIRFKGLGSQSMIQGIEFIRLDSQERWVVSAGKFSSRGITTTSVGMYTADGEVLWKVDIPSTPKSMGANSMVAVGNLTGDDQPEIVHLNQCYTRSGRSTHGLITVLDASGQVLARNDLAAVNYVSTMWITKGGPHGEIVLVGESMQRYKIDMSK